MTKSSGTSDPVTLSLTLPALPDAEMVAMSAVEFLGLHIGADATRLGEATLALTEAVINAIEHAHPEDGIVKVTCSITAERLVLVVQDNGAGFDPSGTEEADLASQISGDDRRGWGLTLMRSLADAVDIHSSADGTRITITKNLV